MLKALNEKKKSVFNKGFTWLLQQLAFLFPLQVIDVDEFSVLFFSVE